MARKVKIIKSNQIFKKPKLIIAGLAILVVAVTAIFFLLSGTATWAPVNNQNALMSSLGYTPEILQAIQKNKTPYVGNNSKVSAIANQLPVTWKGLAYDSLALQTQKEPYGLTINYKESATSPMTDYVSNPFSSAMEENNALLLFAAIGNLTKVTFAGPDGMQMKTFTRATISNIFAGIPSIDDLTAINNKLNKNLKMDEHYFDFAERLGLLRTQPEDLVYRYGVKPDKLLTNKSGLAVYQYGSSFYYYNKSGLYATRELADPVESYADIIAKFGLPINEKIIGNQKYIAYLLRQTAADEPEKYAYFVFEENKTVVSGVIVGTNYAVLSTAATNSGSNK